MKNYDQMMKPYKRKIIFEAILKATMTGLLLGSAMTLLMAAFFTIVLRKNSLPFIIVSVTFGVAVAIAIGIWMYKKRFSANAKRFAKRLDSLGLEERVSTMIEFQKDRSYVAKVQRDDAMDRLSKLNIKQLKVRTPYFSIVTSTAMILAAILLFSLVPMPRVEAEAFEPDPIEEEEDLKKEIIDKMIEEIREIIKEAEQTDPETGENKGISKEFADKLYDIVDNLEKEVNDIDNDPNLKAKEKIQAKYERIRETKKEIERLIAEELERLQEVLGGLQDEEPDDPNNEVIEKLEESILKELAEAIKERNKEKINTALDNLQALVDEAEGNDKKAELLQQMVDALEDAIEKKDTKIIEALDNFKENLKTAIEKEKNEEEYDEDVKFAFAQAKDDLAYAIDIDKLLNDLISAVYSNDQEGIDEAIDNIMEAIYSANNSETFASHIAHDLRAYMNTIEEESDIKDSLLSFAKSLEDLATINVDAIKDEIKMLADVSYKLKMLAEAIEERDTDKIDEALDAIGDDLKTITDHDKMRAKTMAYARKLNASLGENRGYILNALRNLSHGMSNASAGIDSIGEMAADYAKFERDAEKYPDPDPSSYIYDKVDEVIERAKRELRETVDDMKKQEDVIQDIEDKIDQAEKDLVGDIQKEVDDMMDELKDIVDNSNVQDRTPFDDVLDDLQKELDDMIQNDASRDEINSAISDAKDKVNDMLKQEDQKWDDAADVFDQAAENTDNEQLQEAFKDMAGALESKDPDAIKDALDSFKDLYKDVTDPEELVDIFDQLADVFDKAADSQPDDSPLKDIFDKLGDEFRESSDLAFQGKIEESKENADQALDDAFKSEPSDEVKDAMDKFQQAQDSYKDVTDPDELEDIFKEWADQFKDMADSTDNEQLKDIYDQLAQEFEQSADMASKGEIEESKENADNALENAWENLPMDPSFSDAAQDYENKKETADDLLDQMQQAQDKIQPSDQTSQQPDNSEKNPEDKNQGSQDSDSQEEFDETSKDEGTGGGGSSGSDEEAFCPPDPDDPNSVGGKKPVDDIVDDNYVNKEDGKKYDVEGNDSGSGKGKSSSELMDAIDDYINSFGK